VSAKRILDVARSSGDANLGQTLLRLARLAEASHRFEVAASLAGAYEDDARLSTGSAGRIDGQDARPATVPVCTDAAGPRLAGPRSSSVRTEVRR
jgi:hypothetical protein